MFACKSVFCFQGLSGLLSDRTNIRIKRLGELDEKPFLKACKKRFKGEEAEVQYAILCSKWQETLKDSGWYPFKRVGTEDKMKVCYVSYFLETPSHCLCLKFYESSSSTGAGSGG